LHASLKLVPAAECSCGGMEVLGLTILDFGVQELGGAEATVRQQAST
jgi:hypothetical protein